MRVVHQGGVDGFEVAELWRRCDSNWKRMPHSTQVLASNTYKFMFVDNVKAGSTSIRSVLGEQLMGGEQGSHGWTSEMPGESILREVDAAAAKGPCADASRTGAADADADADAEQPVKRFNTLTFIEGALTGFTNFSFVRDPVQKFESGVREAQTQQASLWENVTADEMLDLQLKNCMPGNWINEHLQPSSYRLSGYSRDRPVNLNFVGKLENMESDWATLVNIMLTELDESEKAWLAHSMIKANSKPSYPQSRLSDSGIRKMCKSELYRAEWACFGYPLPPQCRD